MDRLTKPGHKFNLVNVLQGLSRYADVDEILNRLSAYEDTGLEPEDLKKAFNEQAIINLAAQALGTTADRLRELAEADKDGRVAVLKCKVGDTVWFVAGNEVQSATLLKILCEVRQDTMVISGYIHFEMYVYCWEIGDILKLTPEEAEQALKEREQKCLVS